MPQADTFLDCSNFEIRLPLLTLFCTGSSLYGNANRQQKIRILLSLARASFSSVVASVMTNVHLSYILCLQVDSSMIAF